MSEMVAVPTSAWDFEYEGGTLSVTVLTDAIIRVAFMPLSAPPHRTWSVLPTSDNRRTVARVVVDTQDCFQIETAALTMTLDHQTHQCSVRQSSGAILYEGITLADHGDRRSWAMSLAADAHILGGGERTGALDRRGRTLTFWANDALPNYDDRTDAMFQSVALLLQMRGGVVGGLFFDSNWHAQADIGQTDPDCFSYETTGPDLVVYICAGPTFRETLQQYTSITGLMPAQPRWSLGYHQSRWGYRTADEVRAVAAAMRTYQIPCDVLHLDLDYMDGYRNFTWNAERFPDPAGLLAELREQGFRVVTIVDPGVKVDADYRVYREGVAADYMVRNPDGPPFEGWVWPGQSVWADFAREEVRTWWGEQHRALLSQGVAGIWIDMNEPTQADMFAPSEIHIPHGTSLPLNVQHGPREKPLSHAEFHNAYGLEMAHATREALLQWRPDERPFVLTRAASAGSQRYAIVWNGDTTSSWEHLRLAIPMNLSLGLSGFPITGCDLGGFWESTTPELLVRFMQLGAFLPFCRNHSALGTQNQEPWSFGEPYTSAIREAIAWRYRLLPLLVTLAHEASETGAPLMRPLGWLSPTQPELLTIDQEFLLGDDLLVAPIVTEGVSSHQITLPAGEWFDLATGAISVGPVTVPATLTTLPLFARAGAIIPLAGVTAHTAVLPTEPLTLHVFLAHVGQQARATLWDDDDHPEAEDRGTFARYEMTAQWRDAQVTVSMRHVAGTLALRYPGVQVALHLPQGYEAHPHPLSSGADFWQQVFEINSLVNFSYSQRL